MCKECKKKYFQQKILCPNFLVGGNTGTEVKFSTYNNKCLSCDMLVGEWNGVMEFFNILI